MKTIGVVVSYGPNAPEPYIEDEKANDELWKSLYTAIGKQDFWEQISTKRFNKIMDLSNER